MYEGNHLVNKLSCLYNTNANYKMESLNKKKSWGNNDKYNIIDNV